MTKFNDLLKSEQPILLDGAMGTMLMDAGLELGDLPEEWNTSNPEEVRKIQNALLPFVLRNHCP